jgi:ribosomal protein S21
MAMIEVRRKEGENVGSLLYRFSKKVKQSGILKEVKKRKFRDRPINRRKRRLSALYRIKKEQEIAELKKYGFVPGTDKQ